MLATFVIGLREGLEAALIVGIIAAFLKQNGRSDALRRMWAGVVVAVVLCLAVGVALQSVNSALPQRQQEMLECVVAAIAVVMVSYMVLWMRAHSRSLKADLQQAAGGALASGSATALVVMAFLAVFREGFETAVFLLAAFQSAVSPAQAATGASLGVLLAVGLGYLIYRGGVKLDLSKFFRITGVVLVLVAAGLVMSTLRAAYEAGWLTIGQQHAVSLSLIARPGTVQESLLTGVLGIRSTMPVVEVVAYLLYLVPMLAVVLWPARRALTGRILGRALAGTAALAPVLAAGLVALAPSSPASTSASLAVTTVTTGIDPVTGADLAKVGGTGAVSTALAAGNAAVTLGGALTVTSPLQLSGHDVVGGLPAAQYVGRQVTLPVDAAGAGLPTTLTLAQVAALGAGRLPIGLSANGSGNVRVSASYADSVTPTVTIDPSTGTVVDLSVTSVRTVVVTDQAGERFPAGIVRTVDFATTPYAVAGQIAAAAETGDRRGDHQVLGQVIPGLLSIFALILLALAAPHLMRRKRKIVAPVLPTAVGEHESLTPLPSRPGGPGSRST
ncbi:iron uptake transporter permease EfeU [Nakamurella sp. PAMC28650]|uniref:iron uptake transporter permease EfeU n=1 Tax=Nakamurella sp. PAMC28650 TaxID=2762325 RepID=UPI00164E35A1|nr:iron uptake transporter permease EfeU [Nakamurella sp. PAMC28650]QNK81280.1 FTR1 family iron permease [Nakamurella sp. PAMC28650]